MCNTQDKRIRGGISTDKAILSEIYVVLLPFGFISLVGLKMH